MAIGSGKATLSMLNKLPEHFIRRAFFGLFEKSPFMSVDTLLPQNALHHCLIGP